MESTAAKPTPSQRFKDPFTSKTVLIPTRIDKKSGERFVLWEDIQATFKSASYITNDGEVVLFMVDDNFNHLIPRRISYYPGVVLDIVVSASGQSTHPLPEISSQVSGIAVTIVGSPNLATENCNHIHARENGEAVFSRSTLETCTCTKHTHTCEMASTAGSSSNIALGRTQGHGNYGNHVDTVTTAQVMDKNPDPQSSMLITEAQQPCQLVKRSSGGINASDNLTRTSTVTDTLNNSNSTQDATFLLMQKVLENQAVFARQVLQLHQYPIPRLFVVLPKPKRKRDVILKPFRKQFRLFFLCDCGSHTESGNDIHRHKIHLAMHEGYDLDNVDEFFKKYGSYVLTIMKMLKIGFTVAGVVVPGLAHLGIVQGIESTAKTLDMVSRNCRPLLDDASTSLKNQIKGDNDLVERASKPSGMDFSNLKALCGSELRQLESFLRHRDPGRVLGNLNPIVTRDGDVRWVCNNHHPDKSAVVTQDFAAIVRAYNGDVSQDSTFFDVVIKSPDQAKKLYDRMVPGIRFLTIMLEWEVAQEDLRTLELAVTGAGITELILGIRFRKSRHGVVKNMYNPIVQLMCNGHLRFLVMLNSAGFYQRINKFPMIMTSQLQELHIYSLFSPSDTSERSTLKFILKHSPHLRRLVIATNDSCGVLEFLKGQVSRFPNLEDISWKGPGCALRRHDPGVETTRV
ncbi:MAG: hypothetical protein J3Q66DRAFT_410698 [Benniella sp.]|nr:MAG: hypothetical protein J3Q66DRAFT_410698 [Benniella sp.]